MAVSDQLHVPQPVLNAVCHLHTQGWNFLHSRLKDGATHIEAIHNGLTLTLTHNGTTTATINGQPAKVHEFYRAIERKQP